MKIEFKIPNEYNKYLFKIFENINLSDYIFYIPENELIDKNSKYIFEKEIYDYNEIKQIISSNNYYLIFLKLQIYKENIKYKIINNYDDFINSDCELIIFINDCQYAQIYCKDSELFKQIYDNLKNNKFSDINIIEKIRKSFSSYDD